jgi:adenine-specific DNA-methyltransferase
VQKIIDRIIFLRIAEDRKMEEYGKLQGCVDAVKNGKYGSVYEAIQQLFVQADKKYNAGLFVQEDFLKAMKVDDKIFRTIIGDTYYPQCPYEFSVLGVEILGHIYEQFLGKTIRLTNGHQAKVEEKPEVRKA